LRQSIVIIKAFQVPLSRLTNSMEQNPSSELTGSQIIATFQAFYGTQMFIAVFKSTILFSLP